MQTYMRCSLETRLPRPPSQPKPTNQPHPSLPLAATPLGCSDGTTWIHGIPTHPQWNA